MNKEIGGIAIVVICLLVVCVGVLKKRAEFLFTFVVRMVAGGAAIFLTNRFFASREIDLVVGINPISILTVGILGTGGFALLYGIMLYRLL